uniref:Uncharacterized protein n=1 Tax=viral metagenome TaxID=1070528 RepID=A0A6C0CNR9_9ZZZZ
MSDIYKIFQTVNNEIETIYVFIGERLVGKEDIDVEGLFGLEPENALFSDIFSPEEQIIVDQDKNKVKFVRDQIHLDDTVETIKKKYLRAAIGKEATYSGLYLFAKTTEKLDPKAVYQILTQDGQLELTRTRLIQLLLNISYDRIDEIDDKDIFDFDDIISLDLENKNSHEVDIPIGQKFVAREKTYPFTVNPFNVIVYDEFLERNTEELLTTTNQNVLMDKPNITSNTIYACHALDVLRFARENRLSERATIDIYYPYLTSEEIESLEQYESKKAKLDAETQQMIDNESWQTNTENINLFYDINGNKQGNIMPLESGIQSISVEIVPEYNYNLPLDVVFKLIHAEERNPLIKYNPGKRQEKIYRLYTDKTATNGKKIPYLSKGSIFKLMKTIGKSKEVSIYIQYTFEGMTNTMIIDFSSNGSIIIHAEFPRALSVKQAEDLIIEHCNPIISTIQNFLSQRGYNMRGFTTLDDDNIVVSNMDYVLRSPMKKKMNLKSLAKCMSSVFNVISDDINEGAQLRFKRVANYNEMDSQEAYIVEMLNNGSRDIEVIQGLIENFGIKDIEEARSKLADFVSRQQVVQAAFKNRRVKIKNNPGFETIIIKERFEANVVVTVKKINNIKYLDTIPKYITALLIITQNIDDTLVDKTKIKAMCKGSKIQDVAVKEDVIAKAEEPVQVQAAVFGKVDEEPDEEMQDALLDMLVGSSDDESSEEDSDEDSDQEGGHNELMGGADTPEDAVGRDITGMSLTNPNPIQERLMQREPKLFLKNVPKGFKSYSRSCGSTVYRQPIILTPEEKEKIDKDHAGSYDNAISYKSKSDGKLYYYICPKYWSLRDNVSLTQEQVDSGKYGKLIPDKASSVSEGEAIFKLNHTDKTGNYIENYPGFMEPSKHPGGQCIPCCFTSWDKPKQRRMREKCNGGLPDDEVQDVNEEEEGDDAAAVVKGKTKKKRKLKIKPEKATVAKVDEYILGPERFPLDQERFGYLPIAIQKFLHTDNEKCQISSTNKNIRKGYPCLIRTGVEYSMNQSFIAAIANIYAEYNNQQVFSIKEMKEQLLRGLTIDLYLELQNGNLVEIFDDNKEVDIAEFNGTKIHGSLNMTNPEELSLMKKIARSYKNFRRYLEDDEIKIGYEYLWDLICFKNPNLFPSGLNIVILEIANDDITSNVNVLCPSNHYSSSFFDVNKKTCILIKVDDLYEPVIIYEDTGKEYSISRTFSLKYKGLLPNLKAVLDTIKSSLNDKCGPLPSIPKKYVFDTNISLEMVVYQLELKKYTIESQLMNYSGKIIGVIANKKGLTGLIPCFPSPPMPDKSGYIWSDAYQGISYEATKAFLTTVHNVTKKIPCKPAVKVKDDGLIVGIITQTNQFVPINPPVQDTYGNDLETLEDMDYINVNKQSLTDKSKDTERENYIKMIKLETSFFDTFRNTIRMMLGQYKHRRMRENIENIINDTTKTYIYKLRLIDNKLRELVGDKIRFSEYSDETLRDIAEVTNCYLNASEKCEEKAYCVTTQEGCVLLIPNTNLINRQNNEAKYFGQVADELVRYSRIRSFIMEPKAFLSFSEVKYNLKDNEIILLQSLLTQDYFEDLIPMTENRYINQNTYETAEPLETQAYTNEIRQKKAVSREMRSCPKPTISKVAGKWNNKFPAESKELVFPDKPNNCTFEIMMTILEIANKDTGKNYSYNDVKEVLADEYLSIFDDNDRSIIDLLKAEGKSTMMKQLEAGQISIENMIMSDDYYATLLDLWILAKRFNIPLIFYSGTKLLENGEAIMVANKVDTDSYYFVKVPGSRPNVVPKFRLLVSGNPPTALIDSEELAIDFRSDIARQAENTSILSYLEHFEKPKPKKKKFKVVKKIKPAATAAPKKRGRPKKLKKKLKLKSSLTKK